MKFVPHKYQHHALTWLIERTIIEGKSGAGLLLDPGLGKTPTSLLWLRSLSMIGAGSRTLVIAPLRVIYSVWPKEIAKWEQFQHLEHSIIHGSVSKRLAALSTPADIHLINPAGIPWLKNVFENRAVPYDNLIIDESSTFKNWGNVSTKALRKLAPKFKRRIIMTGTPSPNSLQDLFAQIFMVDLGETLGTSISKFRTRYFDRGGFGGYSWIPKPGAKQAIEAAIAPLVMRLSEEDHLDLPDKLINDVWVDLPKDVLKAYKKLEREMFLELETGKDLTPVNSGSKYTSCKQLANGGVYDEDHAMHHIHTAKIEAIKEIVDELQGKPVLIAFQFRHDLERLKHAFHGIQSIDGSTKGNDADKLIDMWNAGQLKWLAVQPQSLSHGVNMQAGPGRDVVWLGLTDDLEVYLQLNKRIHRQGVTGQVRIHRILARSTVDHAMVDRTESKDNYQKSLLEALNSYRKNAHE
jgi:SNF2 family DNA or RNA helicase